MTARAGRGRRFQKLGRHEKSVRSIYVHGAMNPLSNLHPAGISRRRFIKSSAAAATTLGALESVGPVFAAGTERRSGWALWGVAVAGSGAAMNCVLSSPNLEIVALGDVFRDQVDKAFLRLKDDTQPREWSCSAPWRHAVQVTATQETCFAGFDAYQKVLAAGVDLVICCHAARFPPPSI